MKIIYCTPSMQNPGGMERILSEKINYLVQEYNYEVTIVTTDQRRRSPFFHLDPRVRVLDLELNFDLDFNNPLFSRVLRTSRKIIQYRRKLEALLLEQQPDVLVSTGGKELEFLSRIETTCRKILEMHFSQNFREHFLMAQNAGPVYRWVGKYRTRQLIHQTRKLDAVVVLTKKDMRQWQMTHDNVYHIYNFSSFNTDQRADTSGKKAIAVGKLDAQKGFDLLIDAWAQQKEKLSDWTLNIYGQGEWQGKLTQQIKDYQLENSVKLMGVSQDIQNELLKSSLFVFSSRFEGFALVFVEAMTCGLPIVSFDCPEGPSELISHDDIGLLVPAQDVCAFGEGIVRLTSDQQLRQSMGDKAKTKAANFSKTAIMQQWNEFFTKMISHR